MCTFVTATLPTKIKLSALTPVFQKYNFEVRSLEGSVAAKRLAPKEQYFRLASGYCCDSSILGGLLKSEKRPPNFKERDDKEAERWLSFIRDALQVTDQLGLLVHDYHGGLEDEDLPQGKPVRVLLKELKREVLESMKDGVLHRFV